MLLAVLHALASSEHTDAPFLVVMVLPVWDDSPWTSNAIRGHHNMSTLICIPSGHMRFVPVSNQADDESMELKPAKWPVELVLIANELGRAAYLDEDRIRNILSPAIQSTCRLKPEDTIFSPPPLQPRHNTSYQAKAFPTRPLPHRPTTGHTTTFSGPKTPTQGLGTDPPAPQIGHLLHIPGLSLFPCTPTEGIPILA